MQERTALQQHLAIHEALQTSSAADAGRALLTAEQLLVAEGRLSEEWGDVWQAPWRRCAPAALLPATAPRTLLMSAMPS